MNRSQIVVTGASRGIGAAIAIELDRRGFAVAGLSRTGDVPCGFGLACDVRVEADITAAVRTIAERGPIVGLVNGAGAHKGKPSIDLSVSDVDQAMRLNTYSVLTMSQKLYPHLVRSNSSLIVNIGSFFDKLGVPESLAYCASKAAVGAMTRCLATEWARDGIAVLNVAPGYVETDLNRDFLNNEKIRKWLSKRIPGGKPGRPEEIARLVAMLFQEQIPFLTGETLYVDGAQGINH